MGHEGYSDAHYADFAAHYTYRNDVNQDTALPKPERPVSPADGMSLLQAGFLSAVQQTSASGAYVPAAIQQRQRSQTPG